MQRAFPYQQRGDPLQQLVPTVDRYYAHAPGPVNMPKATPWVWQFETEPLGKWQYDPSKSEILVPPPPPTAMPKATPWNYQYRTEPITSWQFNPVKAEWWAPPPPPVKMPQATPWDAELDGTFDGWTSVITTSSRRRRLIAS